MVSYDYDCRQNYYRKFQIQVTQAFHWEYIFQIEAEAYKPILQAALEYQPSGFGTFVCKQHKFLRHLVLFIECIMITMKDMLSYLIFLQ